MELYPAGSINGGTATIFLNDLQRTKGMAGARSIITRPNSRDVAFDEDDDILYIIQTDINNNKTIRRCRFYDEPEPKPEDIFASKDEINELKGEIGDVKQSIRELAATITSTFCKSTDNEPQSGSDFNAQKSVSKSKGNNKPDRGSQSPDESDSRASENNRAN